MSLPTASALELAKACSFPWSPYAPPWQRQEASKHADLGTAVHKLAEAHVLGEWESLTAEQAAEFAGVVDDYSAPIRAALTDLGAAVERQAETVLTVEPFSRWARHLGRGAHRDYGQVYEYEFCGTADVVLYGERITVADWKTGAKARNGKASDSLQLRMLGYALKLIHPNDEVRIALVHLRPGEYWIDGYTLTDWDHDVTEVALREIAREVNSGAPKPRPGPHCKNNYCKIASVCPATKAALASIDTEAAALFPADLLRVDSDDKLRKALVAVDLAEKAVAQLKANATSYVSANGAVDLGNGMHYGLVEETKETLSLDASSAAMVTSELGSELVQIRYKSSKEAIESACKKTQAKRGDGMRRARELFVRLRDAGALTESRYTVAKTFKRKDDGNG